MNLRWFLYFFLHYVDSVSVGLIRNIAFTPLTSLSNNIINGTLHNCLCIMMTSPDIPALNYFSNNTCQLLSNVSLVDATFLWSIDMNSQFYFVQSFTKTEDVTQNTASVETSVFTTAAIDSTTEKIIDPVTTVAGNSNGTAGNGDQTLNGPLDIFLRSDGTLFVADWSNNRVQAFPFNSRIGTTVVSSITHPQGLFIDDLSNLYVTSGGSNKVVIRPTDLSVQPISSSIYNWSILITDAYGVAGDSSGNVYVSSAASSLIRQENINRTNTPVLIANSSLVSGCRHLYLDEQNSSLYVADTLNHRILKIFIHQNMTVQTVAGIKGTPGNTANKLNSPAGVYVSRIDGAIYVADTSNNRIQKWPVGASTGITVAGNSTGIAGSGMYDLHGPYAVILDQTETYLYVADYYNNRVQRFLLP